ncbi:MAG: orotidine-5'-phosphate decarboxylase [Verrucomicrobia bacterium]|nr:orotidine-5'-phosphate decarboxylase [Verrucomicrobiota bacterium]MBU6445882.1 orotidine-5'-phosphate decarboxylase [Verrucomicrobiota bacterium]MDE3047214.1 orotidine-5'-phosphate decarboxylase [Verrucomicrobiota bacterium]
MSKKLSFLKRAHLTRHPMAQKLLKIMEDKQSNLCLAADVASQKQLFALADELGPDLCMLKTHVDILEDFSPDFGAKLRALADKHNFLIFEDRKFADIGQTVLLQYTQGIYRIAEWAHIINAHIVPGPGIIEGLKGSNLLLLAEMSSSGTLAKGAYTRNAVAMAQQYPETVMGLICLHALCKDPGIIHVTPGVKLEPGQDALGQRYRTVDEILIRNKSDIIIVGRDITHAKDPKKTAGLYRKRGWECYVQTLG